MEICRKLAAEAWIKPIDSSNITFIGLKRTMKVRISQMLSKLVNCFAGSEHTLGGLAYPAELHIVHQGVDDPHRLAVLGVFLHVSDFANIPDELGDEREPIDLLGAVGECLREDETALAKIRESGAECPLGEQKLVAKLPAQRNAFFRYDGSLTTPPCTENVLWTVFADPVLISREQVRRFLSS